MANFSPRYSQFQSTYMETENCSENKHNFELIDSLQAHIAIIDDTGKILKTNKSWDDFDDKDIQLKRPAAASDYFDMLQHAVELGNDFALKILLGMKKVLRGEIDSFSQEYPVKTNPNPSWFKCTLRRHDGDWSKFVMIHEDITSIIQTDKKLKESKNRYQIQFEQSMDGILITDTRGSILDANREAHKILGWKNQSLVGHSRSDVMDLQDPEYQRALKQRKKNGTYHIEMQMRHKSGRRLPVEITSRAYRTKSGKLHAIVSFRDISRRKQVEQKLLQNKHFTESALNSIPGIFLVIDREGNLVRWNAHMITEMGYTAEELAGKNALDFIVDDQKIFIEKKIEECIKQGELSIETRVQSKDGTIRDYSFFAKPFVENGQTFVVGTGMDITESKRIERENRKNQLLLEQLFNNAPIGIAIADTDERVQNVNQSFTDLFNYSGEEASQKNINDLIVPEEKRGEAEDFTNITKKGGSLQMETVRQTKEGRNIPVLVGTVPVKLRNEIIAIYGMYVDISEQAEYQNKIEHALQEKETLLAELHHRVKNNLALINSLLELQLFDSTNTELSRELTNIKKRILTIASIHEVLYRNGNLSNLPFNNFLHELIEIGTIANGQADPFDKIDLDTAKLFLGIDQSIPCGLFLNELLSLIFKFHPDNESIKINLRLREYGNQIHLIIEGENIIRCPKEVKEHQSLHNVLINTLIAQLEGTLLWPNSDGNHQKFELFFTKKYSNSPVRKLLEST